VLDLTSQLVQLFDGWCYLFSERAAKGGCEEVRECLGPVYGGGGLNWICDKGQHAEEGPVDGSFSFG
jgi:hypothetical protein